MPGEQDFLAFQSPGTPLKWPSIENPVVVASVAGANAAPTALITTMSGALAINLLSLPWPGFAGTVIIIPTGAFTGATGGVATPTQKPIALAFTAVVGRALALTYSNVSGMWHPHAA
jgi:hypothetical protein